MCKALFSQFLFHKPFHNFLHPYYFVTYFFIENIFYSLGVYLLLLASFINRLSFPDVDKTQKLPE